MIIQPKIRGFICTSAHPQGCAANVQQQIDFVRSRGDLENPPKKVLVIGASTGYGLASRITAAFGGHAATLGIFFEKEPDEKRTASAGWYNSAAFHQAAEKEGLYAKSINGDAFSDEIKQKTIELIKQDLGQVDLVVYSLASPRRQHPDTGVLHTSVLKPIGKSVTQRGVNTNKDKVEEVTIEPATEEEIANTVAVMGGEDWERWISALKEAGVLAENCQTTAYTYLGDRLTWDIYWHGTIGAAKKDLDRAQQAIQENLASLNGKAYVSVLKALVTQSSAAIPIMPLYLALLFRVMKAQGVHEGCIEQIYGLFANGLCQASPETDDHGRLRMDTKELQPAIQREVESLWRQVNDDNLFEISDYQGYKDEFLKLFGFGFDSIDYEAETDPLVSIDLA
ncbi:MAG: trans-2-enoyl-CoA reductase family protein [Pseudomonadales bacterium]|nr:trans-2-enoyl-CoA reductase family protein [Pseudomonadales bacterium]